jgi:hypothetical protein
LDFSYPNALWDILQPTQVTGCPVAGGEMNSVPNSMKGILAFRNTKNRLLRATIHQRRDRFRMTPAAGGGESAGRAHGGTAAVAV